MRKSIQIILIIFVCLLGALLIFGDNDTIKLSGGYTYSQERRHILGKHDIPPKVISYDYDRDFIIVKQKPQRFDNVIYNTDYVYRQGREAVYYWIIIHEGNKILGPMDSVSYVKARIENSVPEKLTL